MLAVTPKSGSGLAVTMTATVSDPDGLWDLQGIQLKLTGRERMCAASFGFKKSFGTPVIDIGLWSQEIGDWLGPISVGSQTSLGLGFCAIDASKASASISGDQVTVSLPFALRGDFSTGANIRVTAIDQSNAATEVYPCNWLLPQDSCTYAVDPAHVDIDKTARDGTLNVIATGGCPWTAVSELR